VAAAPGDARPTIAVVALTVGDNGGPDRCNAELIRRGSDRYRFVVVSRRLDPQLRSLCTWIPVPAPARPFLVKYLVFLARSPARIRQARPDLVHAAGVLTSGRVDLLSVHWSSAEFLQTVSGRHLRVRALALLENAYLRNRKPRMLAALTDVGRRRLADLYPALPITVTPNGVDPERFRPDAEDRAGLRRAAGVEDDEVVVIFVGAFWTRKGLAVAIEGFARARQKEPALAQLWVVGEWPQAAFRRVAERAGVHDRVRFLGFRPDPERFYRAADVFVLPSEYESFGLAPLEAAASGLPLVVTAVNGTDGLLEGDCAGTAVPRDPGAVSEALARLASDPKLRARLGVEARRWASRYTWQRNTELVFDAYEWLLARR
jgi:glycosyltransferase involved in cell wall biosynthesis